MTPEAHDDPPDGFAWVEPGSPEWASMARKLGFADRRAWPAGTRVVRLRANAVQRTVRRCLGCATLGGAALLLFIAATPAEGRHTPPAGMVLGFMGLIPLVFALCWAYVSRWKTWIILTPDWLGVAAGAWRPACGRWLREDILSADVDYREEDCTGADAPAFNKFDRWSVTLTLREGGVVDLLDGFRAMRSNGPPGKRLSVPGERDCRWLAGVIGIWLAAPDGERTKG